MQGRDLNRLRESNVEFVVARHEGEAWNRRRVLSWAGAALSSAALPLGLQGCGDSLDQLAQGPRGKVQQVRSGDSLVLDGGQVVRLAGIEAPYGQAVYAAEARLALSDLVQGQLVQLFYGGARQDAYGRALAHVRLQAGGQWVQKAMLEQGAARVRTYADNRALARPMLDAEARARKDRRGLWTLLAYRVRLPEEAALEPYGFQVVEGRVSSLKDAGYGLTVDLEHWVQADIQRPAQAQFITAGLIAGQLQGRLIRVRGELRRGGGGALMTLDHPEQVERVREA